MLQVIAGRAVTGIGGGGPMSMASLIIVGPVPRTMVPPIDSVANDI